MMKLLIHTGVIVATFATSATAELPIQVGTYPQQSHKSYIDGLPQESFVNLAVDQNDTLYTRSSSGEIFSLDAQQWVPVKSDKNNQSLFNQKFDVESLNISGESISPRDIATRQPETAIAAAEGLFIGNGIAWELVMPLQNNTRWAPVDVRAVAYDAKGQLWFAAPQGVGYRISKDEWKLFTGQDGLPFNDFTCMAAGPSSVWFGTTNGAIQFKDGQWSFRQGKRWLLDNHVNDIVIDSEGNAWIATNTGISCIETGPMTLAKKARFFENEIEKFNRRTTFGYVNPATLSVPGEKTPR
jgi:ligand-binding sensor domain-containing protein